MALTIKRTTNNQNKVKIDFGIIGKLDQTCYNAITIKSVLGTAPLNTQQPTITQGAKS